MGEELQETSRQARTAIRNAVAAPSVAKLHEWRKQGKYLRYQFEVLQPLCPERMEESRAKRECAADY